MSTSSYKGYCDLADPTQSASQSTVPPTEAVAIPNKKAVAAAPASTIVAAKTLAELEAMHTGSLMNRRKALLRCPDTSRLSAQDKASLFGAIQFKDTQVWQNAYRELKSVLDKREHLPNKQERKAQRQARAKRRR